jgi:hypothetical protein
MSVFLPNFYSFKVWRMLSTSWGMFIGSNLHEDDEDEDDDDDDDDDDENDQTDDS